MMNHQRHSCQSLPVGLCFIMCVTLPVPDALVQHVDVGHTLALPYYPIILVSSKIYKYILEYNLQLNPD